MYILCVLALTAGVGVDGSEPISIQLNGRTHLTYFTNTPKLQSTLCMLSPHLLVSLNAA